MGTTSGPNIVQLKFLGNKALLNYPVPRHMGQEGCEQLLEALLPDLA